MLTTTMGKGEVKKQGVKNQSQNTPAMGVGTAISDGYCTSSSLADKRAIQAELIGINGSSKLVSVVAVDDSELKLIACDGDGKPHPVTTKTLESSAVVVRFLCLSRKSNATELFLTHYVLPFSSVPVYYRN